MTPLPLHTPYSAFRCLLAAALLFSSLIPVTSCFAVSAAPQVIPFQGRLTSQQGLSYTSGQYSIIFNLYSQAVGGGTLWTERHEKVGVVNGMINVFLGSINSMTNVDFSTVKYLGITVDVDSNPATADPEMVPRQMIIPAFAAKQAERTRTMDLLDVNGLPVLGQTFGWSSLMSNGNPSTGTIAGAKLTAASVTASQIASGTITATQIASNAITADKIADGQVTAAKLAGAMIGTAQIVDGNVTAVKLAADSVGTVNVQNSAITSAKIADGTIANADLADGIVSQPKLADGAVDLQKLAASVTQMLVPTGTILSYGGTNAPTGYLMCDGNPYLRATYPNLAAVLNTGASTAAFGGTATTFNVPDLRGVFLRGRDGQSPAARDPDRAGRLPLNAGGNAGDLVGSYQADVFASHTHAMTFRNWNNANNDTPGAYALSSGSLGLSATSNVDTQAKGGNETRPKNVNVNYIIKY